MRATTDQTLTPGMKASRREGKALMSKRFVVTLSEEAYALLQAWAEEEERAVAALARKILREAIRRRVKAKGRRKGEES